MENLFFWSISIFISQSSFIDVMSNKTLDEGQLFEDYLKSIESVDIPAETFDLSSSVENPENIQENTSNQLSNFQDDQFHKDMDKIFNDLEVKYKSEVIELGMPLRMDQNISNQPNLITEYPQEDHSNKLNSIHADKNGQLFQERIENIRKIMESPLEINLQESPNGKSQYEDEAAYVDHFSSLVNELKNSESAHVSTPHTNTTFDPNFIYEYNLSNEDIEDILRDLDDYRPNTDLPESSYVENQQNSNHHSDQENSSESANEQQLSQEVLENKFRELGNHCEWTDLRKYSIFEPVSREKWAALCRDLWDKLDKTEYIYRCIPDSILLPSQYYVQFQRPHPQDYIRADFLKCSCYIQHLTHNSTKDTFYVHQYTNKEYFIMRKKRATELYIVSFQTNIEYPDFSLKTAKKQKS